jgi:two-component system OmpR family response regulator
MRLLLLEDDVRLSSLLQRALRAEGYAVDPVASIEDARWMATENSYDTFVFDVMVPDGDAYSLSEELRARGIWTPILMLTARSAVEDRVRGLDAGADDYLGKPFAFSELAARIRSLTRRGPQARPVVVRVGALVIDPAAHRVSVAGQTVPLSTKEFALLELLARRADRVITRTEVLDHVWDWAYDGTSNVVDVYIRYLRNKLAQHRDAPPIETVRGVGYVLRSIGQQP